MNLQTAANNIYRDIKSLYEIISFKSIITEESYKSMLEKDPEYINGYINIRAFLLKNNLKQKSYLGSNNKEIYAKNEKIKQVDEIINNILKKEELSSYFTKKEIICFIVDTIFDIKKNQDKDYLIKKWYDLLSQEKKLYTVIHPIFNINFNTAITIGPFNLQKKEHLYKIISSDLENYPFLDEYYISIKIQAKSPNKAKELSKEYFLLFEDISRYLLSDYNCYDVYIFSEKTLSFSDYKILSDNNRLFHMEISIDNSIRPLNFTQLNDYDKKVWSLVTKYYENKTYNKAISPIEQKLLHAMQLIGKANNTHFNANKYMLYVFAIECLLSQQPSGFITPSISYQIAESCSFIIGENFEKYSEIPSALPPNITTKEEYRKFLFKKAKKIYSNRSKYVHGNIDSVTSEDLTSVIDFTNKLIYSFLTNEELLKLDNMEQLQEWIQDKKFS